MKRTLKIFLSVLLIVSLLVCIAACGSKGPSGTYTLVSMDADGLSLTADDLEALGMTITIEFNSDGTGTIDFAGDAEDFEWKDNKIISGDEELTFELSGSTLTIEEDGGTMVFKK